MYLHLGQSVLISHREIVGIFDLDNTTYNVRAADFINRADKEGRVQLCTDDLPKSVVVTKQRIYLSQFSPSTLLKRVESNSLE